MIYLLHFERPVSGHASHYMGWCRDTPGDLVARLRAHRAGAGNGSVLTRAAVEQGIAMWVVRTWPGTRREERRMKGQPRGSTNLRGRCPLCSLAPAFAQQLPDVRLRARR